MALCFLSPSVCPHLRQHHPLCNSRGSSLVVHHSGALLFLGLSVPPRRRIPSSSLRASRHAAAATGAPTLQRRERGAGVEVEGGEEEEEMQVKELEDLPEQWRRSKVAWLCKQLPDQKPGTLTRLLNAQRKWISQQDVTYIVVHCLRIRENDTAFRVYKWMVGQPRFHFDLALATRLADYLGKDRKFLKCREVFDDIIKQGRVPSESTFHNLTVAYLSAPVQGCLDEACAIYNKMIQVGGYRPQLSLHNALFRALVSKPGRSSKQYLSQAEFIFHNLVTCGLEIQKDVYAGMIWLHSYQDVADTHRIAALREEMRKMGMQENRDVLVSVMRACSKVGVVEEAEQTWDKLLKLDSSLSSQTFVYRMELYAKVGEPMKSLEIFRSMHEYGIDSSVAAFNKIIEVMSKAQKIKIAEEIMGEFVESGLKPLTSSYVNMMDMYLNLNMHEKVEFLFSQCLSKCQASRSIYNIYLSSLVKIGSLEKAEEIFNEMHMNAEIGSNSLSCNIILGAFLASADYVKAEKIYDLMCQKKYDMDPVCMEKFDNVLSLKKKTINKPVSLKLDKEQREMLIGLLLGGLQIVSDEGRRNHSVHFEFNENSYVHSVLRRHIHQRYFEWLTAFSRVTGEDSNLPYRFSTIAHPNFTFFADQFWPKDKPMIPKLIHRWLSERVLAYWYMYGGFRSSSGDILLRLKGGKLEHVRRIIKVLQTKSLNCRVKRKGRVFWIGFQGNDAITFWKLTEPYIFDGVKEHLQPDVQNLPADSVEHQFCGFDAGSDSDEFSD
uniref:Pentatricopeptide repeat-containing protein At2g15820 n=1 Tax=Anthurium amnicola TaxID=1678845 RepID=A0A1D1YYS6_9ARAE